MKQLITLLQEDECAPDAYVYFDKEFKELMGCTVKKFKEAAVRDKEDDDAIVFTLGIYHLACYADFQYWTLSIDPTKFTERTANGAVFNVSRYNKGVKSDLFSRHADFAEAKHYYDVALTECDSVDLTLILESSD